MNSRIVNVGRIVLPAAGVCLFLAAFWAWVRFAYAPGDAARRVGAFLGWVGIAFLVTTVTAVTLAAGAACVKRLALRLALLLVGACMLVLCVGVGGEFISTADAAKVCALLSSWTLLWGMAARVLSRWGAGVGVGKSMLLAMIFLAGPVVLAPAARAVSAASPWQARIAAGIGVGCPLLANLDAMRSSIRIDWAQLPHMYAWSGLGQDIPMELPSWRFNTGVYAAAALLLGIIHWWLNRGRKGAEN